MSWTDELFALAAIVGLGYAAWQFKVKPELERRKKEELSKSKVIDATFQVQSANNGNK